MPGFPRGHRPPQEKPGLVVGMWFKLANSQESSQCAIPVKAKHLYSICTMMDQRQRRWAAVVRMVYAWFSFTGMPRQMTPFPNDNKQ